MVDVHKMKHNYLQIESLLLVLYVIASFRFEPSDAFSVPDLVRLNAKGQPRLCSAVGVGLNVMTRSILCFPSSSKDFSIQVTAASNRQVLLGNLQSISINVQNSQSPLLNVDKFQLQGSNIQLGWTPLLITLSPFIIKILRPPIFKLLTAFWLWKIIQRNRQLANNDAASASAVNKANKPQAADMSSSSLTSRLRKLLGGQPCQLDYVLVLTNDDLQSSLLRRVTKAILQSLMENSVLKTAAIAGDAAQILQDSSMDEKTGQLVLKESNFRLTKLLAATSFEFKEPPTFTQDGHLVMSSQAVLPDETTAQSGREQEVEKPDSRSKLDFVLRTKIRGNDVWLPELEGRQHGLEFSSPEIRFDMKAISLPSLVGNFLPPILWLPVGSGVGIPLGQRHRIRQVKISDGKCQLNGQVKLFGDKQESGGLARRFEGMFGNPQRMLPSWQDPKE